MIKKSTSGLIRKPNMLSSTKAVKLATALMDMQEELLRDRPTSTAAADILSKKLGFRVTPANILRFIKRSEHDENGVIPDFRPVTANAGQYSPAKANERVAQLSTAVKQLTDEIRQLQASVSASHARIHHLEVELGIKRIDARCAAPQSASFINSR